jgi:hypothetical protein
MLPVKLIAKWTATAAVCLFAAAGAGARGASPYLPLDQSPDIERKIERVMILAGQPVLTRPLAAATVLDALPAACERDAVLCADVRRYLNGLMRTAGIAHGSLAAGAAGDEAVVLPNRHGMTSDSRYELGAAVYFQPGDHVLVSGGVQAYDGETTLTGTLVSFGGQYAQVDMGFRDHWLAPLTGSSMLVSTEAATMPSVTVSNYTPLSRLRLRYEFFMAELGESANIAFAGGLTAGSPKLAGLHVSIEPFPGWSVGVNRIMQFGGGERGASFGDFLDAFFDPAGADNTGSVGEFGNQAASFVSSFVLPTELPAVAYFEYAGEDTSRLQWYRLGNASFAAGVRLPAIGGFDVTLEATEWQNGWYVHHIFGDSFRNEGRIIGHWAGDQRVTGDGVGAFSWLASVGWQPAFGGDIAATYRSLRNDAYTSPDYRRGHHLTAEYTRPWGEFRIGAALDAGRSVLGESYARATVLIRY